MEYSSLILMHCLGEADGYWMEAELESIREKWILTQKSENVKIQRY